MDDPEYDRLLDEARVTFDQEAQDAILAEFHARMVDDAAWLWVAHDVGPRAMQPRVKGFVQAKNWFQDLTPVYIEEGVVAAGGEGVPAAAGLEAR